MIRIQISNFRFNAKAVVAAGRRASRTVFARQGAYIRGIARRSIRRRKDFGKKSAAGSPPYTHTGALKKSIVFSVNPASVIIGPTASEIGGIGHSHEFGGVEPAKPSRKRKNNWKFKVGGHGPIAIENGRIIFAKLRSKSMVARSRRIALEIPAGMTMYKPRRRYPKRPFMAPALAAGRSKLPEFWHNAIRRIA